MRPIYREGKVHVMRVMCSTCIFRPGNLMHLQPGRVAGMVKEANAAESAIICHSTLSGDQAVCRGFDNLKSTFPLRLARAMGVVCEVEEPKK